MYDKYESEKDLIPVGNLIEIKFEDVEADAMTATERIYKELSLPYFDEARPVIEAYINKKKGYKKNKYNYDSRTVELVENRWGFALDKWNYRIENN